MRDLICLAVLVAATESLAEDSPRSIGYADPSAIHTLLEYRLPSWGYRTWDVGVDLDGHGRESVDDRSTFDTSVRTNLAVYRESESVVRSFHTGLSGSFQRANVDAANDLRDDHSRSARSEVQLGAWESRYVSPSIFFTYQGSTSARYQESKRDRADQLSLERYLAASVEGGVGWGRQRNVTPLLQAQRISERLSALGRERLPSKRVLELAELLSQRQGYGIVFDRSDKHFWSKVFDLLSQDRPFTAFEVLYVREALLEQLGGRVQGFAVTVGGQLSRSTTEREPFGGTDRTLAGPTLTLSWAANPSLTHQFELTGRALYSWKIDGGIGPQAGFGSARATHLWALADRLLWEQSIFGRLVYQELTGQEARHVRRGWNAGFETDFSWFVEDRMAIESQLRLTYDDVYAREEEESWRWDVSISLNYYLDRLLL